MATKSKQSCDATLTIGAVTKEGVTGRTGHAEMDALNNFIIEDPWDRKTIKLATATLVEKLLDGETTKTVFCPSRACCKKCSAVLQALGFEAGASSSFSDTYNSDRMTEWGVTLNVKAVLKACNVDYAAIQAL